MPSLRLSETALKARSQQRRIQTRKANAHTLILDTQANTGECSCGRWAMSDRCYPVSPVDLKRNHDRHVAVVTQPNGATSMDLDGHRVDTFPVKYHSLRERLFSEAKNHPAFNGMTLAKPTGLTPGEITETVENRLMAVVGAYPWWYAGLKKDQEKRGPTEAQLAALQKARQRKAAIQRETDSPYVPSDADELADA